MLSFSQLSFEFAGRYLYKDANWHIKPNERIGLVGKNGTGKSTLLKLITGEYEVREGTMSMTKGLHIGYLHQDLLSLETDEPIRTAAMKAFEKALQVEKDIERLLDVVEKDPSEENIIALTEKQQEFDRLDGYVMGPKTEEILEGLGFTTEYLERPLSEFSGGWRMRVILAQMLLSKPDLLLLDEPTNHLDLPSIEWLEQYLSTYPGTVIIVSHDRDFLNRLTTKIVEIANKKIYVWDGNYDFYLNAKEERDNLQQRQYENQQQFIKDQEKFINRFRAKATKAKAVQSRVKMLEKLDRIEEVEDNGPDITLRFDLEKQPGKVILEGEDVSKAYGSNQILSQTDFHLARGGKVALIGANGKGKSTLLRMIAQEEPHEGEIRDGHNVQTAIYAQHQVDQLTVENEILDELKHAAPTKTETELRTLLGCFLFQGDDVFKKIKVLSGGEKARVALAKTLLSRANFLLLDEPTNHLDIDSIEILIDALNQYEGTFIVVSHNRYFLNRIANTIWWIEDQQVKEYPGTFDEYERWKDKRQKAQASVRTEPKNKPAQQDKTTDHKKDRNKQNQLRKIVQQVESLEKKNASLKDEIAELESKMLDPELSRDHEALFELSTEFEQLKKKMGSNTEKMEELILEQMELEEELNG
jgi:ATP-binding cassette subfamily F protein 3